MPAPAGMIATRIRKKGILRQKIFPKQPRGQKRKIA